MVVVVVVVVVDGVTLFLFPPPKRPLSNPPDFFVVVVVGLRVVVAGPRVVLRVVLSVEVPLLESFSNLLMRLATLPVLVRGVVGLRLLVPMSTLKLVPPEVRLAPLPAAIWAKVGLLRLLLRFMVGRRVVVVAEGSGPILPPASLLMSPVDGEKVEC